MSDEIVIDPSIYGFPEVGFGGYVSGRLAAFVGDAAQVLLRSPPPLGRGLRVTPAGERRVQLHDGKRLVAQAVAEQLDVDVPEVVGFEEATAASAAFPGWRDHPSGMCFGCGVDRSPGEGLRIFPGRVGERPLAAAPWVPHERFASPDGVVRPEFLWSALDCPTLWGVRTVSEVDGLTTARIHAAITGEARAGERCVVVGWPVRPDGPKYVGGAAVFGEEGRVVAVAEATWLPLPKR